MYELTESGRQKLDSQETSDIEFQVLTMADSEQLYADTASRDFPRKRKFANTVRDLENNKYIRFYAKSSEDKLLEQIFGR